MHRRFGTLHRQTGSALIIALVFLLLMTVIGVAASRTTTIQERMAGNVRDRNIAFQSAEAALRAGEAELQAATLPQFTGANGLLLQQPLGGRAAFWNSYNWAEGSRTGPAIDGAAAAPRYVIEEMAPIPGSGDSIRFGPLPDVGVYRVTARSVGGNDDAVVILQTTYRR